MAALACRERLRPHLLRREAAQVLLNIETHCLKSPPCDLQLMLGEQFAVARVQYECLDAVLQHVFSAQSLEPVRDGRCTKQRVSGGFAAVHRDHVDERLRLVSDGSRQEGGSRPALLRRTLLIAVHDQVRERWSSRFLLAVWLGMRWRSKSNELATAVQLVPAAVIHQLAI